MTRVSGLISAQLQEYAHAHSTPPDELQRDLIVETERLFADLVDMQIGADQGTFMTMLVRLVGARFAVEVGTFTGYSAIAIARGLGEGGRLLCCDISTRFTAVAQRYWELAGVADRIDLAIAPAVETLRGLPAAPPIDFAFIDADKESYVDYWEEIVPRVRPGGLVVVDNALFSGRVLQSAPESPAVAGVQRFNDHARGDDRVDLVLLPIGDGVTVARKR